MAHSSLGLRAQHALPIGTRYAWGWAVLAATRSGVSKRSSRLVSSSCLGVEYTANAIEPAVRARRMPVWPSSVTRADRRNPSGAGASISTLRGAFHPDAGIAEGVAGKLGCAPTVWGGLHYRSTVEETSKYFPQIARDVGKKYFLKSKSD